MYNLSKFILVVIVLAAVISGVAVRNIAHGRGLLHVYFLNVGQGDAIFIVTPHGNQVLIDGGPDRSVLREISSVMRFYDRSIDVVILTHPDADHVTGLIDVLSRYDVDYIVETGIACETPHCHVWKESVAQEGAQHVLAQAGYKLEIDRGVYMEVLHPSGSVRDDPAEESNNTSLVVRLTYGEQSVLLTGDIEKRVEERVLFLVDELDSDFLKVAHHGSKTSSTDAFLSAVSPKAAFIQVGERNTYNHPHPTVTDRLANLAITYYRTDKDGRIELLLDGTRYKVLTGNRANSTYN